MFASILTSIRDNKKRFILLLLAIALVAFVFNSDSGRFSRQDTSDVRPDGSGGTGQFSGDEGQPSFGVGGSTPHKDLTPADYERGKLDNPERVDDNFNDEVKTDEYSITYYKDSNSYQISVTKAPFSLNRPLAEKAFLEVTGFSEAEACSKNVYITVSTKVSVEYGGQTLKLSFCR